MHSLAEIMIAAATLPPADASYSSVSLLLHGNGANGSTSFPDSSKNALTVTANGNAQVSTSVKKFGTGSISLDGAGDYLSILNNAVFSFGTGDFTIEAWVYIAATGAYQILFDARTADTAQAYVGIIDPSGYPQFYDGGTYTSTIAVAATTWTHVAFSRSGTTLKIFVNGAQGYSGAHSTSESPAGPFCIGGRTHTATLYLGGYLDEFRVTKGVARYTGAFTPQAYEASNY